jgi:hypothetical protein
MGSIPIQGIPILGDSLLQEVPMNLTGEKAAPYPGRAKIQSGGKKVSWGYPLNNGSINGPN